MPTTKVVGIFLEQVMRNCHTPKGEPLAELSPSSLPVIWRTNYVRFLSLPKKQMDRQIAYPLLQSLALILEQVMRIELTTTAWEAVVLPLNYTCARLFMDSISKKILFVNGNQPKISLNFKNLLVKDIFWRKFVED